MKIFLIAFMFALSFIGTQSFASEEVKSKKYKYSLAMTAIFRNDADYLKEWIEFHNLVGVEHFYLINNLSIDNYLEVLKPYIDKGLVELIDWPYEHTNCSEWNLIQCAAYEYIVDIAKGKAKWLAVIDTDEFLFPTHGGNLVDLLSNFKRYACLAVNWQVFGTSFVSKIPDDKLLIEMLTLKTSEFAEINRHIKSIVRPEYVKGCNNPHFMIYKKGKYEVNSDSLPFEGPFSPYVQVNVIRINHYTVRDEHFLYTYKLPRLTKWGFDAKSFEEGYQSLNQFQDETIFRYIPALRERIFIDN